MGWIESVEPVGTKEFTNSCTFFFNRNRPKRQMMRVLRKRSPWYRPQGGGKGTNPCLSPLGNQKFNLLGAGQQILLSLGR